MKKDNLTFLPHSAYSELDSKHKTNDILVDEISTACYLPKNDHSFITCQSNKLFCTFILPIALYITVFSSAFLLRFY